MKTAFEFGLDRSDTPTPSLVRIWILRMLVRFGKYRKLIDRQGQTTDDYDLLAHAIGIAHWGESDQGITARKALNELQRKLKQEAAVTDSHLAPSALAYNARQVAAMLGLTEVERRILEFCVLLHSESALENSADLLGPLGAWQVSPILSVLLDLPEPEVRVALSGRAILAQSGLISMECGDKYPLSTLLGLMPGLGERMLSQEADTLDLFRDAFAPAPAAELALSDYAHIQPGLDILVPYLRGALAEGHPGVNIYLHGLPGTGKSQLTRTLARALQAELFSVSSENEHGDPIDGERRLRALRAAQHVLKASRALLVFDEADDVFDDGFSLFGLKSSAQKRKGWINQMLEGNPVPCLWLSNFIDGMDPAFIRRFDMVLEMPVPPRAQRERLIADTCGDLVDAQAIAQLARCENLAPAVIARAAKVVRAIQEDLPNRSAAVERLVSSTLVAQGHAPIWLGDGQALPPFYHPGFVNVDADLMALAEGIARAGSARLCLFGPPGTGKTAYGHWLADRLNRPLRTQRVSDLMSPYVGMTEKNLARAFRTAETEQAVFLLDEVDGFLQDRRQARNGWEVTAVNEILTQMEAYSGIFIASTNLMDGLDPAALRRFDLKVRFDFLRPEQAWELLWHHARSLGLGEPGSDMAGRLRKLAVLTPGDFATVARQARIQPFAAVEDLVTALTAECVAKEEGRHMSIGFL